MGLWESNYKSDLTDEWGYLYEDITAEDLAVILLTEEVYPDSAREHYCKVGGYFRTNYGALFRRVGTKERDWVHLRVRE